VFGYYYPDPDTGGPGGDGNKEKVCVTAQFAFLKRQSDDLDALAELLTYSRRPQ